MPAESIGGEAKTRGENVINNAQWASCVTTAAGRPAWAFGEPQVQQRGVIAQVTADVVEQVVSQELGQAVAALLVAARLSANAR